jgi:hypothetical protein
MAVDCVFGQSSAGPSPQQLAATARAAKDQFRPLTEADARQALTRLTAAVGELDARLTSAGQTGEDWRKYLLWDKLQAQVQRPQPDMDVLGTVLARFSAGHEGLELKWFVRVRQPLQQYSDLCGAVGNPAVKDAYTACLDRLAGQLESWAAHPNTEAMDQIAESAAWLESRRQVPDLVQAVRACFGRPNFHARIGGELLAAGFAGPVDEMEPISDVILGTTLQGMGHTLGQTESRLVPDTACGVFDAVLLATNQSQNVGSHPPVCIYTCGTTSIGACKRFWLDETGLHAWPAVSQVQTSSTISDIRDTKCRAMVEKIAWRKALKQEAQADAIASMHTQQRVNRRIDDEAAAPLEKANTNYEAKVRRPLGDRLAFPRGLAFSTAADAILSSGWQSAPDQLAAPNDAPEPSVPSELSVRIHESAINNLAATVLGGMEVRKEMFQAAVTDFLGHVPERFKDEQDEEPWTVVFDPRRPLTVSFADDTFSVTIRGVRYYFRGEKSPRPATNIKAVYKLVKTEQGFKAVRQGALEFLPPDFVKGVSKLTPRHIQLYTILQRKLGNALKPELVPQGFTLGGKFAAAGRFMPVELSTRDGWLVIGWRRTAAPPPTATAAAR